MTSASGALVNEHDEVLLQERADTGDWGFPGGYMEFGESFAETVQREFKEDAGIAVVPVQQLALLDQDLYTYPNGDKVQPVNVLYLVQPVDDKRYAVKPSETIATKYFALSGQPPRLFNEQHEKMWQIVKNFVLGQEK